jgi:hypothetical protein
VVYAAALTGDAVNSSQEGTREIVALSAKTSKQQSNGLVVMERPVSVSEQTTLTGYFDKPADFSIISLILNPNI